MFDAHVHYLRREWVDALWTPELRRSSSLWPKLGLRLPQLIDAAHVLAAMDARGIERAIIFPELSIAPGPQMPGGLPAALAITRSMNDMTAALEMRHPDRFWGLAVVNPLGNADDLAELRRAVVALGLHGVAVGASYRGATIDAPDARSFLASVEALDVPLVIHPTVGGPGQTQRDLSLDLLQGVPMDLTQVAVRLIASGRLTEFPRLRVVLPHLGGGLLALLGWLDAMAEELRPRPAVRARRFWVDTATASQAALAGAIMAFGADHIMFGTDWPLSSPAQRDDPQGDPVALLNTLSLSPAECDAISGHTAQKLFGDAAGH
jgi:predicted TIM-barrel fold metal-dependent hydrolase